MSSAVRSSIYEFVNWHPGSNIRDIRTNLELSSSSATHHLKLLEDSGKLFSKNNSGSRRYFVNGHYWYSRDQQSFVETMTDQVARLVYQYLLDCGGSVHGKGELAKTFDLYTPGLDWHLKKLMGVDAIIVEKQGKSHIVKVNPKTSAAYERVLNCLDEIAIYAAFIERLNAPVIELPFVEELTEPTGTKTDEQLIDKYAGEILSLPQTVIPIPVAQSKLA